MAFSANQLMIVSDNDLRTVFINVLTGTIASEAVTPTNYSVGIYATMLPALVWGGASPRFPGVSGDHLVIVDGSLTPIASLDVYPISTFVNNHTYPVASDFSHTFYMGHSGFGVINPPVTNVPASIRSISDAGVVGGTTWTLPHITLNGLAVNRAGTRAYYAEDSQSAYGTNPTKSPVHVFDISGAGSALPDLVAGGGPGIVGIVMQILPGTGDLLIAVQPDRAVDSWEVRRISVTTGATLTTYPVGAMNGIDVGIAVDLTNQVTFWTWTTPDPSLTTCTFTQFEVSSGLILRQLVMPMATAPNQAGKVPAGTFAGFFAQTVAPPPSIPPSPPATGVGCVLADPAAIV